MLKPSLTRSATVLVSIAVLLVGISLVTAFKSFAGANRPALLLSDLSPALLVKMLATDTSSVPLDIHDIDIDIKVTGNIAVTTMTLIFYNDLKRNLEGEFVFPLAEGQTIHYFAMSVNDSMRQGVVVEKEEGRKVFESVERTRIDPGLLEWTQGNNFRARVFPIPAKGYKKFVVAMQQELTPKDSSLLYSLPLAFRNKVAHFSIKAEVNGTPQSPVLTADNAYLLNFKNQNENWMASAQYKNIIPNQTIAFQIFPGNSLPVVYTAKIPGDADKYYFYALLNTHKTNVQKPLATDPCILWDVSGSASNRDRDKELKIIENYFDKTGNAKATVVVFSIAVHAFKEFNIHNGNSLELRKYLESFEPDGGTQLGCLHLADYKSDEFIMFSDGVNTYGSDSLQFSKAPVYCIATGSSADFSALQFISRSSGGKFVNATTLDPANVSDAIAQAGFNFFSSQTTSGSLSNVYPSLPVACGTYMGVAGIMSGTNAQLKLNFKDGAGNVLNAVIPVTNQNKADVDLLARLWAQKKISELDLQYEKNKDEITTLGKQYSIITRNTSLIVLDRIEDYIRYKIMPPNEDMRKQYEAYQNKETPDKKSTSLNSSVQHLEKVVSDFNGIIAWWNMDFTPVKPKIDSTSTGSLNHNNTDPLTISPPGDNSLQDVVITGARSEQRISEQTTSESVVSYDMVSVNVVDASPGVSAGRTGTFRKQKEVGDPNTRNYFESEPLKGDIKLTAWDPKQPYLDELKKAGEKNLYKKYLGLRSQYQESPSFFIDAAEYFMKMNQREEAIRIISNLVELKTESPELLRILAHHLQQWNENGAAIATYQAVLKLRGEEPQSYRDLGLAYGQNKDYQKATAMLCRVINTEWDHRFPCIESFTACEMNHLLAGSAVKVNTDSLDKRLIKQMPVDVRVVIDWDADDCDIDLWVTDPVGEKCYYNNKLTKTGGHISSDFTGGYGPEDFNVKKAIPGIYKVQVHYFASHKQSLAGPVTVHAQMYTNYGRPNEVKKEMNVRLTTDKEVIDIGQFEFVN